MVTKVVTKVVTTVTEFAESGSTHGWQCAEEASRCEISFVCHLLASTAQADSISGRVIRIADGDTITVLDAGRRQHKIRLAGIDAPEKAQPFGQRSKLNLSKLVFNKTVTVESDKQDRYGREVGKVMVNGIDANLEQIKAGMAWWYEKYRKEQIKEDQQRYAEAEQGAKENGVGLWRDPSAVPPWEWRQKQREK